MIIDGINIHVENYSTTSQTAVVLAHGMFSNRKTMSGIARYLGSLGVEVWSFDFKGHGESENSLNIAEYDEQCLRDVETVISVVLKDRSHCKIQWVGHSGGGLAILMYLAKQQMHCSLIDSIVLMSSQATQAGSGFMQGVKIRLIRAALRLIKEIPGPRLGLGPESEPATIMKQWCNWNINNSWVDSIGFDYLAAMGQIRVPVLALAGVGDKFIAPYGGCRSLFDSLGGDDNVFKLCGIEQGYSEDYTHSRIVRSRPAMEEIWPLIYQWVSGREQLK